MSDLPFCFIDGANIGHFNTVQGMQNVKKFRSDRLLQAVSACHEWQLRPRVMLPEKFITSRHKHNMSKDVKSLLAMEAEGLLVRLPSYINDDKPILDAAMNNDGYVLSNDGFQDHLKSGKISQLWAKTKQFRCHVHFNGDDALTLIPPADYNGYTPPNRAPPNRVPPSRSRAPPNPNQKSTKSSSSNSSNSSISNPNSIPSRQHQLQSHTPTVHLQQRVNALEKEVAQLRASNKLHRVFDQLARAETEEEFRQVFATIEKLIPNFQEEDFKRMESIKNLIHHGEMRQDAWFVVNAKYLGIMEQRREELRQREEERMRREAEAQRREQELQRQQQQRKQQQLQRQQQLREDREKVLRKQQRQHFKLDSSRQQQHNSAWQNSGPPTAAPTAFLQRSRPPPAADRQQPAQRTPQEIQMERAISASLQSAQEEEARKLRIMKEEEEVRQQSVMHASYDYDQALQKALHASAQDTAATAAAFEEEDKMAIQKALHASAQDTAAATAAAAAAFEKEKQVYEAALEASLRL